MKEKVYMAVRKITIEFCKHKVKVKISPSNIGLTMKNHSIKVYMDLYQCQLISTQQEANKFMLNVEKYLSSF